MALKLKSTFFIILSKIALCTAFNPKTWPSNKEIEANNSSDPWGPSPWGSEEKEREILDIGWGSGEEEDEEWVSNGFFILFIVIGIIVVMVRKIHIMKFEANFIHRAEPCPFLELKRILLQKARS